MITPRSFPSPSSATMSATMDPTCTNAHGRAPTRNHLYGKVAPLRAYQSHNAGVAGSSPAPAIRQPVVLIEDGGLLCVAPPPCATTIATKAPKNGVCVECFGPLALDRSCPDCGYSSGSAP